MSRLSVAVVDADTPGNVGTIARAMKNFGVSALYLVDPPALEADGEAYGFAGRAREDVLPDAREVEFEFLVENFHTVGCTAITPDDERRSVRYPFRTPRELADSLAGVDADTCLVFGRERVGLSNEELGRLDEVCSVPASAEYPVMNLGQAATVVLYEMRELTLDDDQHPDAVDRAPEQDIEGLYGQWAGLLDAADVRENDRDRVQRLFRRVLGRAHPTTREASTLRGVFRRAEDRLRGELYGDEE